MQPGLLPVCTRLLERDLKQCKQEEDPAVSKYAGKASSKITERRLPQKEATMPDEPKSEQNMCPYCIQAFNQQDVVIKIWDWFPGTPTGPEWAHLDCALDASKREKRNHPLA